MCRKSNKTLGAPPSRKHFDFFICDLLFKFSIKEKKHKKLKNEKSQNPLYSMYILKMCDFASSKSFLSFFFLLLTEI